MNKQFGGSTFGRRDKSEAAFIVPFCESAFDAHMFVMAKVKAQRTTANGAKCRLQLVRWNVLFAKRAEPFPLRQVVQASSSKVSFHPSVKTVVCPNGTLGDSLVAFISARRRAGHP